MIMGTAGGEAVRGVVGNDRHFCPGVFFFEDADLFFFHVHRAEHEVDHARDLIEVSFGVEEDHIGEFFGDGGSHGPAAGYSVAVFFAGGSGGGGECGHFEPGMICQKKAEALTDHAGRADDGSSVFTHNNSLLIRKIFRIKKGAGKAPKGTDRTERALRPEKR